MKASIIICNFNGEKTLARAIRSALAQNMPRETFEVIVIDDCSKDNSRIIMETFGDHIKAIYLEENQGLPHAINTGIFNSQGEYIARLDSDDMLRHNFLSMATEYLDWNKTYDWVKVHYIIIDDKENQIGIGKDDLACCMVFRRYALESAGLYNPNLRVNETLDLLVRLYQDPRFANHGGELPIPLYKWFKHPGSLTDGGKKGKV